MVSKLALILQQSTLYHDSIKKDKTNIGCGERSCLEHTVRVNVDSWILLSNNVGSTPDTRERLDKEYSKVDDLLEITDTT